MNVVVMGAQWGDEGKGKIVDYLAQDAKYVVRFAGGANAGHTIVVDGKKYALHQVPSGILYPEKSVFLGSGMVIDPEALFKELQMLKDNGINWEGRVFISDRAHLTLPGYREMDKARDAARKRPIGTTGRGIGTTYSMKSERDGIRLADLEISLQRCTSSAMTIFFSKVHRALCSTLTLVHIHMYLPEHLVQLVLQQVPELVLRPSTRFTVYSRLMKLV